MQKILTVIKDPRVPIQPKLAISKMKVKQRLHLELENIKMAPMIIIILMMVTKRKKIETILHLNHPAKFHIKVMKEMKIQVSMHMKYRRIII